MLGEVAGDDDEEFMKKIKVGNLPPEGREIPPHYLDKPGCLEFRQDSPKRGWATARFEANLFDFRVHLTIVGPQPEQPERAFALTRRQTEDLTQAIHHLVVTLQKQAWGEGLPRP